MLFAKSKAQKSQLFATLRKAADMQLTNNNKEQRCLHSPVAQIAKNCHSAPSPSNKATVEAAAAPSTLQQFIYTDLFVFIPIGVVVSTVSERRAMRKDYPGNGNLHKRRSDNIFLLLAIKATQRFGFALRRPTCWLSSRRSTCCLRLQICNAATAAGQAQVTRCLLNWQHFQFIAYFSVISRLFSLCIIAAFLFAHSLYTYVCSMCVCVCVCWCTQSAKSFDKQAEKIIICFRFYGDKQNLFGLMVFLGSAHTHAHIFTHLI